MNNKIKLIKPEPKKKKCRTPISTSLPVIYVCMRENLFVWDRGREICVCVCVRERERKREGEVEICSGVWRSRTRKTKSQKKSEDRYTGRCMCVEEKKTWGKKKEKMYGWKKKKKPKERKGK